MYGGLPTAVSSIVSSKLLYNNLRMRINQCFANTMAEKRYTAAALKNAVAEIQSGEATSMHAVAVSMQSP